MHVARIKPGVTKLRRTTQSDLSASFTASKLRIGILNTIGASIDAAGLRASTFRLTPGGSTKLTVRNAFLVHANRGTFVAIRRSKDRYSGMGYIPKCRTQPFRNQMLPHARHGRPRRRSNSPSACRKKSRSSYRLRGCPTRRRQITGTEDQMTDKQYTRVNLEAVATAASSVFRSTTLGSNCSGPQRRIFSCSG